MAEQKAQPQPAKQPPLHIINFRGDDFGCGFYRMIFPAMGCKTLLSQTNTFTFTESIIPVLDPNFYRQTNVRAVRIQRWYGQDKLNILEQFLKPLSQQLGFWLIYEIDDVLFGDDIPKYNIAHEFYSQPGIPDTIRKIINLCDLITTTTDVLADYYTNRFGFPREKIVVIPNYLPRWWAGNSYNFDRRVQLWKDTHHKPRVAFACSLNHFDVHNKNNGIDDFSHVIPWIDYHIQKNDIHFIFVGSVPKSLEKYIKSKQIEVQPPSDIMNYLHELEYRNIDLLVAPLVDNLFNCCKSNIKWIECGALGIPMVGQNIVTYNKYTNMLFNDGNELENIVNNLFWKSNSKKTYTDLIKFNKNVIDNGDKLAPNGYWMERNIQEYVNLYTMPQKTFNLKF